MTTTFKFEPECSICSGTGQSSGHPCVCTYGSQVHPNMARPSIPSSAAPRCVHRWPEADGQTDLHGCCTKCGMSFQLYIHMECP